MPLWLRTLIFQQEENRHGRAVDDRLKGRISDRTNVRLNAPRIARLAHAGADDAVPLLGRGGCGHYWITSSARSSNDGGITRPSAFAVLRLITSSNFVGCSTGRSPGLAPLRILSTKCAVRRNMLEVHSVAHETASIDCLLRAAHCGHAIIQRLLDQPRPIHVEHRA